MEIKGETVTFREGRWVCGCRDYEDKGTCPHEIEAIAHKLRGSTRQDVQCLHDAQQDHGHPQGALADRRNDSGDDGAEQENHGNR
jgi:hypothetical protein